VGENRRTDTVQRTAAPQDVSALKIEFNIESHYDLVQYTWRSLSAICTPSHPLF